VALFSDHGMTTLIEEVDIKSIIEDSELSAGIDYISFLDSTMARFWYENDKAKNKIHRKLASLKYGHFLSIDEMKSMGIYYPDSKYGEDIFLVSPGIQIVPSDMSPNSLPGMHGYTPDDKDSDACWMSSFQPTKPPKEVKDIFHCMMEKMNEV